MIIGLQVCYLTFAIRVLVRSLRRVISDSKNYRMFPICEFLAAPLRGRKVIDGRCINTWLPREMKGSDVDRPRPYFRRTWASGKFEMEESMI